jgi:hypothetical protein
VNLGCPCGRTYYQDKCAIGNMTVTEWLMFGKSRVEISTERPAILAEVFRGFPLFLQAFTGIVSRIRPRTLDNLTSIRH